MIPALFFFLRSFSTCSRHRPWQRRGCHMLICDVGAHPRKRRGEPPTHDAVPVAQFELRRDMYHWFIDRVERHVRRGGAERRLAPLHCGTTRHEASAPLSPHEISNGLSEEVFFSQSGPELSATMDYAYLKFCGLVARKCSTQPR